MKIKSNYIAVLVIVILLVVFLLVQFIIKDNKSGATSFQKEKPKSSSAQTKTPTRYFSSSSDKVKISISNQTLYTNNPAAQLTYYALNNSDKPVKFREDDRAFVRILGITRVFNSNIEILHPQEQDNSKDYTIFKGNITFPEAGVYLVKVCLGKSINLDEAGNKVWPFGCFEDQTSVQVNVYDAVNQNVN